MVFEKIREYLAVGEPRPNKFTIYLGEAVRKAREEMGMSQEQLAKAIYLRRATLSDIENGKTEPDAGTLSMLAHVLDKHIGYFYPWSLYKELRQEELSPLENELILHFRDIFDEHLQKVAVNQVRDLAKFDPTKTLWDAVDLTIIKKERDAHITEFIGSKKKKR